MAQSIQIVPKFSFPYVETHINDYTLVKDVMINANTDDQTVRYIFPFVSSKGIDNKFIKKTNRAEIVAAYGETNFKKYGQPLMQALQAAEPTNTEVWCMRVMPDDASFAHAIVSAYYKADTGAEVTKASNRKFRIKYVSKTAATPIISVEDLKAQAAKLDGAGQDGVYTDAEGYTQIPGVVTIYSAGRGKYGNNYRVRIAQDLYYEKDYGIKFYDFEVLTTEGGLTKEATYVGATSTSTKYNEATLISDVLEDAEEGKVPVYIDIDEAGVEDLYNAYVQWATDLLPQLEAEYATLTDEQAEEKAKIQAMLDEVSNVPDLDGFDIFFGRKIASLSTNALIEFPVALPANVTLKDGETEEDYIFNAAYTTSDNVVAWDSVAGAQLKAGTDGIFDVEEEGVTLEDKISACYVKAFKGTYDKRILSPKRIKAKALWDANYPMEVKKEMAELALLRNDAICYLDCGIMPAFTGTALNNMISDYSLFDDYKISKNVHHYYIKESTTKKRVPVTITYFLSRQYADHIYNYGSHIPFVKSYAQLTGHVRDSLAPSVEDFETELKETLTENRFNFFETVDDNVYQRATQNTSQLSLSDLLEENNVTTLYEMKRIVENDITDRLYDFSDAESRQRFRNYEKAKFADWSGREVEKFDIDFRMSDWEADRSILHAYIDVTFRGLQKRAILEIDINKRTNDSEVAQ